MGDPLNLRTLLIYRDPANALMAKRLLEERGCYAKIFPVPKGASLGIGGCGICVAVENAVPVANLDPNPAKIVELPASVLDAFFEVEGEKSEGTGPGSG